MTKYLPQHDMEAGDNRTFEVTVMDAAPVPSRFTFASNPVPKGVTVRMRVSLLTHAGAGRASLHWEGISRA